jgi:flagellum-specific ATP synthase
VVGFRDGRALVMPLGSLDGITLGARADFEDRPASIYPSTAWLGRVIDGFAQAMDDKGGLPQGTVPYPIKAAPPPAIRRGRVGKKLDLGVRAMNAFTTCCAGQRMGIFAGSGVGKSTLLSMLARNSQADAIVIGLIGERGREVKEFIEDDLGEEGLARSVVVAATSDEPPLVRRQAAYVAMTVAEHLRDQGLNVLLLMDSVTRFAMAQREIGLSAGEPPASKGYTPTVFAELPRLLERAGPGAEGSGTITGLFTVLVEGDDHNEPVSDAVRGILDGHIVLERAIAERGRFPAINILKSVSRAMPGCNTEDEQKLVLRARLPLTIYEDMAELIRLGAYKAGTNPEVDEAMRLYPQLEAFLAQGKTERAVLSEGYGALSAILGGAEGDAL